MPRGMQGRTQPLLRITPGIQQMGPVRNVDCAVANGHDDRLLALARAGSRTAWDQLVLDNGDALWRAIVSCGLTGPDALSVWQFTWLTLSQQMDAVPAVGGLRRWLLATAALESA